MCAVLLPPGVNPVAVNNISSYSVRIRLHLSTKSKSHLQALLKEYKWGIVTAVFLRPQPFQAKIYTLEKLQNA